MEGRSAKAEEEVAEASEMVRLLHRINSTLVKLHNLVFDLVGSVEHGVNWQVQEITKALQPVIKAAERSEIWREEETSHTGTDEVIAEGEAELEREAKARAEAEKEAEKMGEDEEMGEVEKEAFPGPPSSAPRAAE